MNASPPPQTSGYRYAIYPPQYIFTALYAFPNIYLQDKPYHKLKSDLIPHANYLHEIKELFSKRLKEI
ncbi:hypothetical protein AHK31_22050, partial [Salmonella enterica]|nr:hypothetical protein [Salmonella enterica]EBP7737251.1 hypothetical protein [Salmonella enterica]